MPEALLAVRELEAFYGDFQALFGVSVEVARGEAVAVIGARPKLISSHNNNCGLAISARPSAAICCWPPDSAVLGNLRRWPSAGNNS